jgi:hypothetical protein
VQGTQLLYRGEIIRLPRVSLLCFIDCDGLVETFMTSGTFDLLTIIRCCRQFALSGQAQQYPSMRSVWILDGARIHCHPSFTYYLRSLGILPILPAYCPFFNPIEFFFVVVKRHMRRNYREACTKANDIRKVIATILDSFRNYSLRKVFQHCGYVPIRLF